MVAEPASVGSYGPGGSRNFVFRGPMRRQMKARKKKKKKGHTDNNRLCALCGSVRRRAVPHKMNCCLLAQLSMLLQDKSLHC